MPTRPLKMPRRSSSSVRVRFLDRTAVLAELRTLSSALGGKHPEIEQIRLFGSLARGTRNPYADADLLVVVHATDLPFKDRSARYKPVGSPDATDVVVCTQEEFARELLSDNRFIRRVKAESLVLYARAPGHRRRRNRPQHVVRPRTPR